MEAQERIELDSMPEKTSDGRDELNLAEFPLCTLAHRLHPGQKTIRFEDRIWDDRRGMTITRQLTVTGSDAYGLPTALDDEVLLGLIQLSKLLGFADRQVSFTRYQLIRILGWRNESKSYERIEMSLNRWMGVTLYYQNAWWNKARRCWMNEKFHVLDNVWLCHRAEGSIDAAEHETGAPRSAFVWNDVIFRSFQAGNLKGIDFDFYRDLQSAVAKRLYRFLDKRFFHRRRWEFNLKEFAWEHVGLARSYDTASIKRKLCPGIMELETKGYLRPMADADRFRKICSGEWCVVFETRPVESRSKSGGPMVAESGSLTAALTERGITPSTAREIVRQYSAEKIIAQLEVFDWLVLRQDRKVSQNPPGFLISSIKGEYLPPHAFVSREQRARREQQAIERRRQAKMRQNQRRIKRQETEEQRERAVQAYWQSLSEPDRLRVEREALSRARPLQRKLIAAGGSGGEAAKRAVMEAYVTELLQGGG